MNILLAEDNNLSRELLRRIIESNGQHTTALAQDGEEAAALLGDASKHFDVCIFDIYMPKKTGLELVKDMRADERLKRTAVILCTTADDRQTVQKAASLGVAHYIVKPYIRTVVLNKLQQIANEIGEVGALEDPNLVCERLGIEHDMHRSLLQALVTDLDEWCARLRGTLDPVEVEKLFLRGRGIRGSCLNLGAKHAVTQIIKIETVLQDFLSQQANSGAALPLPLLQAPLEELERNIKLVGKQIKAAA
jgi:two-component system chemotaxis response regulator CheY